MDKNLYPGILIASVLLVLLIVDIYFRSLESVVPLLETDWFRWRIFVLALLIAFTGSFFRVQHLRKEKNRHEEFSRKLIETREEEWKRIASVLHDGLGQNMLVIKSELTQNINSPAVQGEVKENLLRVSSMVQDTIEEIRNVSSALYPHQLENLGLKKALESMVGKIASSSGINFRINIEDIDSIFSQEAEINLYRVIQELLNNIFKHSGASEASVEVTRNPSYVSIKVSDNGIGPDSVGRARGMNDGGFGLQNLSERVRLLGGKMKADSKSHKGTSLEITIPLRKTIM
jgi:signal transduction histidine kinase